MSMISIRHYIDLVESASTQHAYRDVMTPAGKGSVVKIIGNSVYVMMDGGNDVKEFKSSEVRDAEQVERRKEPRSNYSFTAAQMAAGRNTPAISETSRYQPKLKRRLKR